MIRITLVWMIAILTIAGCRSGGSEVAGRVAFLKQLNMKIYTESYANPDSVCGVDDVKRIVRDMEINNLKSQKKLFLDDLENGRVIISKTTWRRINQGEGDGTILSWDGGDYKLILKVGGAIDHKPAK